MGGGVEYPLLNYLKNREIKDGLQVPKVEKEKHCREHNAKLVRFEIPTWIELCCPEEIC